MIRQKRHKNILLEAQSVFQPQVYDEPSTEELLTVLEPETLADMLYPVHSQPIRLSSATIGKNPRPMCNQRSALTGRSMRGRRKEDSKERKPSIDKVDFISRNHHNQHTERFQKLDLLWRRKGLQYERLLVIKPPELALLALQITGNTNNMTQMCFVWLVF